MDAGDSDDSFLRAARRARRVRVAIVCVLVAGIATAIVWYFTSGAGEPAKRDAEVVKLTDGEAAELRRIVDDLRRGAEVASAAWKTAVEVDALMAVTAGAEPCGEVPPSKLTTQQLADYVNRTAKTPPLELAEVVYQTTGPVADPPSLASTLARAGAIEGHLASGTAQPAELEAARAMRRPSGVVVLVVGSHREPAPSGDGFEPGRASGVAYVYSYDQRRIVCTGKLDVTSSSTIAINAQTEPRRFEDSLARDFGVQLLAALARELRAVAK